MTRPARTAQEMFPIVEAYLQRDRTKKVFCSEHDISESVLSYWVTKYRRERGPEASSFLEITPSTAPGEHAAMEVVYPHGVRLRLFTWPGSAELERLVEIGHRVA